MEEKPFVENAADKDQVREAGNKEKRHREIELKELKDVLTTLPGRKLIWRYLGVTGVFKSSWHPSALIHFNEGKRDVGLQMLSDVTDAGPEFLIQMMRESQEKK